MDTAARVTAAAVVLIVDVFAWADRKKDRACEGNAGTGADQRIGHIARTVHLIDKILAFALGDIENWRARARVLGVGDPIELIKIAFLMVEIDGEVSTGTDRSGAERNSSPTDGALRATVGLGDPLGDRKSVV